MLCGTLFNVCTDIQLSTVVMFYATMFNACTDRQLSTGHVLLAKPTELKSDQKFIHSVNAVVAQKYSFASESDPSFSL